MRYLVCKKQVGEGCDYTIGCGMRFDFIEADSIKGVIEMVVFPDGRVERSALEGEGALEQILIIPAECVTVVDVTGMANDIKETRRRESAQRGQRMRSMSEFYAEGNAGGDCVQIEPLDNDTVKLLVGHCCVYTIRAVVPVEFITAALTKAVDDAGSIEGFLRGLGWKEDFTDMLVSKVRPLTWTEI